MKRKTLKRQIEEDEGTTVPNNRGGTERLFKPGVGSTSGGNKIKSMMSACEREYSGGK